MVSSFLFFLIHSVISGNSNSIPIYSKSIPINKNSPSDLSGLYDGRFRNHHRNEGNEASIIFIFHRNKTGPFLKNRRKAGNNRLVCPNEASALFRVDPDFSGIFPGSRHNHRRDTSFMLIALSAFWNLLRRAKSDCSFWRRIPGVSEKSAFYFPQILKTKKGA